MIIRRDEGLLESRLAVLSRYRLITFACACAARLENTARTFVTCAATEILSEIVRSVSMYVSDGICPDCKSDEEKLLQAMPAEDEAPDFVSSIVEDALAAGVYALRVLRDGEPRDAVWAARRAYETADRKVQQKLNVPDIGPSEERYILQNEVVQTELRRQERDLMELEQLDDVNRAGMYRIITRAHNEKICI